MIRRYLRPVDVVAIHDMQIEKFGGAQGLRDAGQLESALFRPQSGYYTDVIAEAAALWESLSQNHPFVDGNKRTAMTSTFVFLGLNGFHVRASDLQARSFVADCYETGTFTFENIETWLPEQVKPA